jgi:uncharacterized Zn-binding protein involved in type VI secretion
MAGRPAARITDLTAHGAPLLPGPGSPNVIIGGLLAWRGVPAAMGQQMKLLSEQNQREIDLAVAPPAKAAAMAKGIAAGSAMAAAFPCDKSLCPPPPIPSVHGIGVVIDGSQTVLINNLPACRLGDTVQEAISTNKIVVGLPTVLIGG